MRKKAALVSLIVLVFASVALSDEPPSWENFEVRSANNRYMAEVKARIGQENKKYHEMEYELSVYELTGERRRKLWSAAYHYDGYPGGLLSDDGSAFIY